MYTKPSPKPASTVFAPTSGSAGAEVRRARQHAWGLVLLGGSALSILAALAFESLGLVGENVRPLPFVSALVLIQLGFFAFWPIMRRGGGEASTVLQGVMRQSVFPSAGSSREAQEVGRQLANVRAKTPAKPSFDSEDRRGSNGPLSRLPETRRRSRHIALWDENDPRVDLALFQANVPTFILSQDQRFLDWNPAFDLVFGECHGVRRGAHISAWFSHLDNFCRLENRKHQLFGEGILPLADRNRATFISKAFGRMVFTKIMNPMVDRQTGKVIGWTVVLNVNSVNRRSQFLDAMYGAIARDTRAVRHAAAYAGIMGNYRPYKNLMALHAKALEGCRQVLQVYPGTGLLTGAFLEQGSRVTAVENDVHLMRRLRSDHQRFGKNLRIVRQDADDLRKVPQARYDAVVLDLNVQRIDFPLDLLKNLHRALKPGGVLSIAATLPSGGVSQLFHDIRRDLVEQKRFDQLKYQFDAVRDHEADRLRQRPYGFRTRENIRAAILEAGLTIDEEVSGLLDGHTLYLNGRKL